MENLVVWFFFPDRPSLTIRPYHTYVTLRKLKTANLGKSHVFFVKLYSQRFNPKPKFHIKKCFYLKTPVFV